MAYNTVIDKNTHARKTISISAKRQITIPQKYYDVLGFGNEAECIMQKEGLLIRPVRSTNGGEFAEQILADLISQGYSGSILMEKFKEYNRAVRPAVEKMIEDAESYVKNGDGDVPREELFGSEEQ